MNVHRCVLIFFVNQTTYILDLGFGLLKQLVLVVGLTVETLPADVEVARLARVDMLRCFLATITHDVEFYPFLV